MTTTITLPPTLKATLEPAVLSALEMALAPPPERRASSSVEFEVEAEGEGTFVVAYKDRAASAKKGFAKKPLVSARLGKGTWPLLREQLQAAVEGFPSAPLLRARRDAFHALSAGDLDGALAALARIAEGTALRFDIAGAGSITVARGPVDEATKEMVIALDAACLRGLLSGAPLSTVAAVVKGDRTVGTAALAALGPVVAKLRA